MEIDEFLRKAKMKPKKTTGVGIPGLFPPNLFSLVASSPGEGKTWVELAAMMHAAYGADYLGYKVAKTPVLIIDSENYNLHDRLERLKKGLENDGHKKHETIEIIHLSAFKLDDKDTWDEVISAIGSIQPGIISFDHLACFHDQDENSTTQMKRVADAFFKFMDMAKASSLVLHHFRKAEGTFAARVRGASSFYAKSEAAYEVRALSHKEEPITKEIVLEKMGLIAHPRKGPRPQPIRIRIEEGLDWVKLKHDGTFNPIDDPRLDGLTHRILDMFYEDNDEKTVNKVRELMAGMSSDNETRLILADLEERDLLEVERKGKGGAQHYKLPPTPKPCPWCGGTPSI